MLMRVVTQEWGFLLRHKPSLNPFKMLLNRLNEPLCPQIQAVRGMIYPFIRTKLAPKALGLGKPGLGPPPTAFVAQNGFQRVI